MKNLHYADDTVLDKVMEDSPKKGLTTDFKKTKCMVYSKKGVCWSPKNQQVADFSYLRSMITTDGRRDVEIK